MNEVMDQLIKLFNKCLNNKLIFDCNSPKGQVCIYQINDSGEVDIVTYGMFTEDDLNGIHQEVDAYLESQIAKENVV